MEISTKLITFVGEFRRSFYIIFEKKSLRLDDFLFRRQCFVRFIPNESSVSSVKAYNVRDMLFFIVPSQNDRYKRTFSFSLLCIYLYICIYFFLKNNVDVFISLKFEAIISNVAKWQTWQMIHYPVRFCNLHTNKTSNIVFHKISRY